MSTNTKHLHIISRSEEPFGDRIQTGELLAHELRELGVNDDVVVLGIPRGGILVAREIAHALDAEMDIVLSRKLGAPGNPELAIGAIGEDGSFSINKSLSMQVGADDEYIEQEKNVQLTEIARRTALFRKIYPKIHLEDRIVVITDDGVATGATMQAALWTAHQEKPKRLIAAIPVGPEDTLKRLADDADEVVCLRVPVFFGALSQFYSRFEQIQDEEVLNILKEEARRMGEK
jgi:putative phosphoribosyl transferase